ncbi:MAG: hypothetical protein AAB554_02675 [Patescibacteria group bacterium]
MTELFIHHPFGIQASYRFSSHAGTAPDVLVVSRDPGSANALIPVIERLRQDDPAIDIRFLPDLVAKQIFLKRYELEEAPLEAPPRTVLTSASVSCNELETHARTIYPGVPLVAVEDNYFTSYAWLERLRALRLPFPERYCAIDAVSARKAVETFPELAGRVVVTGQPACDVIASERTADIGADARRRLGVGPEESVVFFASSPGLLQLVQAMATRLGSMKTPFRFVFRHHPRDSVSKEAYESPLTEAGVRILDVGTLTNAQALCMADVVMTSFSSDPLLALCRRKAVVYLRDRKYLRMEGSDELLPPPVEAGVAAMIDDVDVLASILTGILSDVSKRLRLDAPGYYRLDGQNARRAADAVRRFMTPVAENGQQ